ncbi:uncharacterized protein LOC124169542 [Ischnura elegans]|uniref:uncharacterized protein LOC124169542 n=1 Tax=Ischnura elegans TaxID=197161 RepID=UPI001ED86A61|nr:uncharacterized protein LOC124169542 [Ischnura elegans]
MDLRGVFLVLLVAVLTAADPLDEEGGGSEAISRKERFLLATLKFRNERCQINNDRGVCKSWKECWLLGGRSVGQCPLGHGVCCSVQYTCGNVTSERVSYFVNPNVIPSYCSLRVNVYDRRVTQLRLDFETFKLDQPTISGANPGANIYPPYLCNNDTFTVSSPSTGLSGNLGFENLCGENSGQHIYVPVNATTGSATVELAFHLADRTQYSGLIQPQWKIRITQIDCCAPDTKDLCAPQGCLQYYPERTGQFESFNYNNGNGHYQGYLNYAICFKRYDGVCSIQYTSTGFQLAANNLMNSYGTAGCNLATTDPTMPNSQDYLFIPDARVDPTGTMDSLFCGDSIRNYTTRTSAPGPMYVFFHTDGLAEEAMLGPEIGFQMRYSESGTGCYRTNWING